MVHSAHPRKVPRKDGGREMLGFLESRADVCRPGAKSATCWSIRMHKVRSEADVAEICSIVCAKGWEVERGVIEWSGGVLLEA